MEMWQQLWVRGCNVLLFFFLNWVECVWCDGEHDEMRNRRKQVQTQFVRLFSLSDKYQLKRYESLPPAMGWIVPQTFFYNNDFGIR